MLEEGRHKSELVVPIAADALELPFASGSFDGAMVGWGLRNLVDLDGGLAEAARVLKPGSRFVILEMAVPEQPLLRAGFHLYFRHIMPWIGRLISKHTTAYSWLPESARVFPPPAELARRMQAQGFCGVGYKLFIGGVCAMHVGTKREE
jgi:demethylmenaquinone methyltransferase/2-methoxy-6-polyprenyl-1,4-benzoquinol methylase